MPPRPHSSKLRPTTTGSPDLWACYRDNLPRHLMGISRELQARVMHDLIDRRGYTALRLSFAPFLSLIWEEARSASAIAEELSISKQACGQIANLIEAAGYLERMPNPTDRRSKLVRLTRKGRSLVEDGANLIAGSDADYSALVGATRYHEFTEALLDVYQGIRATRQILPSAGPEHRQSVGLLPMIVEDLQRTLMMSATSRGHAGLKMSHGQVLTLIGPQGGRIHEIARVQRVSRQAISAISQDLEAHGYLRRAPDPLDRRGVVLTLTRKGQTLIADSVAGVVELESQLESMIGAGRLEALRRVASEIYRALQLEEEVFERTRDARPARRTTP